MRALSAGVVAGILGFEILVTVWLARLFFNGTVITFQSPLDLATILITSAGLILAVATVMIALVSVWGLVDLRDRAAVAGRDEVKEYIRSDEFKALVYRAAQEFIRYDTESGVGSDKESDDIATALMDGGDNHDGE